DREEERRQEAALARARHADDVDVCRRLMEREAKGPTEGQGAIVSKSQRAHRQEKCLPIISQGSPPVYGVSDRPTRPNRCGGLGVFSSDALGGDGGARRGLGGIPFSCAVAGGGETRLGGGAGSRLRFISSRRPAIGS